MFGRKAQKTDFEREVRIEMEILTKLHGADAARIAREKADRPTNRTARRKVLEEAARQLDRSLRKPQRSLISLFFG